MNTLSKQDRTPIIFKLAKDLMAHMATPTSRSDFFSNLTSLLRAQFAFDRLCINLYDQESGRLFLFTDAEGIVVSSLSSVRVAGENTVAGKVIASRGPVVITNLARYFSENEINPLTEAGISTTMAFPLIVNEQIIGTLHCSFYKEPENVYNYTEFLSELCPFIATCLALILSLENSDLHLPLYENFDMPQSDSFIVGSGLMKNLLEEVRVVSQLDIPILILGETGTGKSLLAQHIHKLSNRNNKNFVKVNCPALVSSLFESELFGHAKGSFTGAANKRIGRFELAHNGTLFLDEIAELSAEMQSKLLHALEESSFERVGESSPLSVDVRMVTATNVDIPKALSEGRLRPDFYYRLAAYTITLPPLRERKQDIPPLIEYLGTQSAKALGLHRLKINASIKEMLIEHAWQGNIRELKNVIQQLLIQQAVHKNLRFYDVDLILKKSSQLYSIPTDQNIAQNSQILPKENISTPPINKAIHSEEINNDLSLHENEKRFITKALMESHGRISGPHGAAKKLGLPRSTLQYRMKKLGIEY